MGIHKDLEGRPHRREGPGEQLVRLQPQVLICRERLFPGVAFVASDHDVPVKRGRAALSPDMALRIEKAFGPKMDTLLRMQTACEIAEARDREAGIKVKRYAAKPSAPHEYRDRQVL